MVARRIYWAILILSVIVGVYFYGIAPDRYNPDFLVIFALVPFLMFAGSLHGLLAHMVKPSVKGTMIGYSLFLGILFVFLFLIHVFIILPLVCPDFLNG